MRDYEHKVQYDETNKMQFTHHSNYIKFMEEARVDFMEQLGFGYEGMEAAGIVSSVIAVSCDYKKPTSFPDAIRIVINVPELSQVKLKLGYTMTVGEDVVCTANSTHCFLNHTGRPVSLKKHLPGFYNKLEKMKDYL